MNWFIQILQKEARGRRFRANDRVRYFTEGRKGKGDIVITPRFMKGTVTEYDSEGRRYKVRGSDGLDVDVHPRNMVPESISRQEVSPAEVVTPEFVNIAPVETPLIAEAQIKR